jgi:hypothetical protein
MERPVRNGRSFRLIRNDFAKPVTRSITPATFTFQPGT